MFHLTSTILILIIPIVINTEKILIVTPLAIKSYFNNVKPVTMKMAERGHQITVVSPFPFPKHPNIAEFLIEDKVKFELMDLTNLDLISLMDIIWEAYVNLTSNLLDNKPFQNLLLSDANFDLLITMYLPYEFSLAVLIHRYNAPSVNIFCHSSASQAYWLTGEYFNPAYQPEVKTSFDDNMTFWNRLYNSYVTMVNLIYTYWVVLPKHEKMLESYEEKLPFLKDRPPLEDLVSENALMIIPTHHTTDYIPAHSPFVKHIAGLSIRENKPLAQPFEDFINNAPKGVIVVSWSTMVNGKKIDMCRTDLVSAFGKLRQKVIWKEKNTSISSIPSNVLVSEWLPLQDLLAHRNVLIYMTHGGLNSITEATNYGVPMIITPFFLDQFKNAKRIAKDNAGIILHSDNITVKSVLWVVNEVINNPIYKESAKRRAAMFKDRLMSPVDEAVYWIEYVLKYGDVLKPITATLPTYKRFLLDVICLVAVIVYILFYIQYKIFYHCFK